MVNPGLAVVDDRGAVRPVLAEAVPSLENGLWKLQPDGRMETTWRIRDGARWHDGTAFTSDDLLFTAQVGRDRTTGAFGNAAYSTVEGITARDSQTVVVTWKEPFIDADQMFTIAFGYPLPRHLLEGPYQEDPASLSQLPYWTQGYVGSGPYRLREYAVGTKIALEAFDAFVLGRPKIDEIDLVYIPDPNTALSNLFSGTVDLSVGIGIPIDAALEMRDRWREGNFSFEFSDHRWYVIDPQFIDPSPSIIGDLRFRRALLQAIDRQEMADTLQAGLAPVANTYMAPNQPDYRDLEARVPRYAYDPRLAVQAIQDLGYTRAADGIFRDAANRPLEVEIWASSDAVTKPMLSVADYWQRIGVMSVTSVIPPQRANDWVWRATFPGFTMFTGTHDVSGVQALLGSRSRGPENNFEVSGLPNWPRYKNAEMDSLVNRFYRTIPKAERIEVLTQINQHIAENLNLMGLFYFPTPYAIASRLANIPIGRASKSSIAWNVEEWNVK
jgi:peptide/nickel transport system substrate-binding protein